jgi:NAD(P)H-dependent FMN reductase
MAKLIPLINRQAPPREHLFLAATALKKFHLTKNSTLQQWRNLNPEKKIVITRSTRAKRVGPSVTKFIMGILEIELAPFDGNSFSLILIDLADFKLPIFDEEVISAMVPAFAQFAHTHSKTWSAAIATYDGCVLATANYNGGPPGAIKNAIDYQYNEWTTKPIMIISYGI